MRGLIERLDDLDHHGLCAALELGIQQRLRGLSLAIEGEFDNGIG